MARLFGQELTRDELQARVGDLSQVAGIRLMQLQEGAEAGVRIADVRTGSGLRFQVSLDRGMDISSAEYKGIPLAWRSAVGDVHPGFYEPRALGWLHTFPGGLMTGCGLTYAGAPCTDEGEELGLHGRLSHIPAHDVRTNTEWVGDSCVCTVEGVMPEFHPFKEHMVLRRAIAVTLGESVITFRDSVVNRGSQTTPLMLLYHVNVGWPIVDEGSRLLLNARKVQPRDAVAAPGLPQAGSFSPPVPGFAEQVYYCDAKADEDGYAMALLANDRLDLGVSVRYRQRELPRLIEWKMMGKGTYVVGIEPANCLVTGRADERARGTLQFLEPGEERNFLVHIEVHDGVHRLREVIEKNSLS